MIKDIPGYEGLYQASEDGIIYGLHRQWVTGKNTHRSVPFRKVAFNIDKWGYCHTSLRKNGHSKNFLIHWLIGKTFLSESFFIGAQINHKDGNKQNNNVNNLEYLTPGDNQRHAFKLGLKVPTRACKPIIQFDQYFNHIRDWESLKQIEDEKRFDRSAIIRVCKGRQNSCYGFKWAYKKKETKEFASAS